EKVLYAVDELSGLIIAAALVRPSRSLMDLEPSSVKKKWKDKGFAAGVDRTVIEKGAAMLGMELPDLIRESILGMRPVEKELGLGSR
ncbi:MAG TPA: hydrolase, partial [Spirochaetota bacterium]|nr:hydrolase [Spirochaetota bacterium]